MPSFIRLLRTLCLSSSLLALGACANASPDTVKSASYTLATGQTADLGAGLALHFDKAEDSRCPKDVVCIRAGALIYFFTLSSKLNAESFTLSPGAAGFASIQRKGLGIALADQPPPPVTKANERPTSYSVTVQVTAP